MACRRIAGLLIFMLAGGLTGTAADWVDLTPQRWVPGPSSPPVQTSAGGLRLDLPFDTGVERCFWDVPIAPPPDAATAIVVDCDPQGDGTAIRAVTLHLRDGQDWLSAEAAATSFNRGGLVFHRADFRSETGTPDWSKATTLRISVWKGAQHAASLQVRSIRTVRSSVAIVRGSERTAPGAAAVAQRSADRAVRLFEKGGLLPAVVDDNLEKLDPDAWKLLVLPYNPVLDDGTVRKLEDFVEKQSGRLAVFYQADARLARAMGVEPLPYATQTQPWQTVRFDTNRSAALPAAMPHMTRHLIPVRGDGNAAETTGWWATAGGFVDRAVPAAAAGSRGIWFSHIPPLATPSAVQWLLAGLAPLDPEFAEALQAFTELQAVRDRDVIASTNRWAASNAVMAVWSPPLPARQRAAMMDALVSNGVNAVFEQVATAGAIRDGANAELSPLRRSPRASARVRQTVKTARERGLAYHAWVILWNAEALAVKDRERLAAEGRLMQDAAGQTLPWLCPSHPKNRKMLQEMLLALVACADGKLEGIHLDYVRYPARDGCYAPATRRAFEARLGRGVERWPADVLPGATLAGDYEAFRKEEITSFVREAAAALRAAQPGITFSAAVYPTPASAAANGQDWVAWLNEGLVDFVCPMLYTEREERFASDLDIVCRAVPDPGRVIPGIGVTADESQLDALGVLQQTLTARARGCGGAALFQLDAEVLGRVLPLLRQSGDADDAVKPAPQPE